MRLFCFNRRRDACFPATQVAAELQMQLPTFQSQTRRLLPRNETPACRAASLTDVSIADATLASPQLHLLATSQASSMVSIADATLASPQQKLMQAYRGRSDVSIADATLASPQPAGRQHLSACKRRFNRRRDACFPATA